jgi:hypothetical protein
MLVLRHRAFDPQGRAKKAISISSGETPGRFKRPTTKPIVFAIAQTPCTHTAVSGARDFETKGGYMLVDAIVLFEAARQVCEWSGRLT